MVSIVVRTHNRAELLKRALECLVRQTYRPIEIFVVDHNSSDNTRQVAASFGDIVVYHLHKGNFRDTFNVWRDRIAGEFVSVLDDDDFIRPDCIEKLANVLLENDSIDVAFCRHRFFHVTEDRCTVEKETGRLDCDGITRLLLEGNYVPWNAVLFKRSCLREIPEIDESITGSFDWFFWIQMALAGFRFYQCDEVLGYIRRSPDSVQFETLRMGKGDLDCVKYFGRHLKARDRLSYGYYYHYGHRLICYAITCLEDNDIRTGRLLLLKGIFIFLLSFKKRLWLLPAALIFLSSIISDPKTARIRVEKLFGIYLFRNYHQKKMGQGVFVPRNP